MPGRGLQEGEALMTPGRNIATFAFDVINQDESVVQRGQMLALVRAD